uniref:AP complex mu/sigma subunit domain-containing protein n=2 Tax=Aegilops tauschii subsp. strangulata TaxID=200361 RepID=A0A453IKP2_AEGTS
MIQAVMVISTLGKPRLLKFYDFQDPEKHQELVRGVFQLLSARPEGVSNFVEADAIFGPVVNLLQLS